MQAAWLLAVALAAASAPRPPRSAARPKAPVVPQKAITCAGSTLSTLARIGPGQLLLLGCGDGRRFLQVRVRGRPLAAMPLAELWPKGPWEFRDSARVQVRSRNRSLVPLLIALKGAKVPRAAGPLSGDGAAATTFGEAIVVVAADFEQNTLSVAFRSPAAPAVTYALQDLDGDGIAELRLGLDDGKRREVRTFSMGLGPGSGEEWRGAIAGPLGAAAPALCAGSGAAPNECDPVLDFDLEVRALRDATYLFARGRDRLCGSGGCALVIVRIAKGGAGREVFRDFGLWTIGPASAGRPPCVTIRNREGVPQKRCWSGTSYGG